VLVSEPIKNKATTLKMQWACVPQDSKHAHNPSTGVCCVAVFRKDKEL